ncbi:MAG: carboxypeptidase-like regulatory domain-containing protein [Bryobacteraceae bacterium]
MSATGKRTYAVRTAACALAGVLLLPLPVTAVSPISLSGAIGGAVMDQAGIPQMGATVLLYSAKEKLFGRALTGDDGLFSFPNLAPGAYSIRVSLSSFLPAMREDILVKPGGRSILNVNLSSLLSSIDLVYPGSEERAVMTEDWKWVLRTSAATRPVLRFQPGFSLEDPLAAQQSASAFSDTRGLLRVSAADGGMASGDRSDLGTAFALATSLYGRNHLEFSGNFGYTTSSGLPTAGFRTTYTRDAQLGSSPELSVMMRQLYLPGRVGAGLASRGMGDAGLPALRTLSVSYQDGSDLSDVLRVDYGFALDSVTFLDRLNYFSPYGRLTYLLGDSSALEFSYASGLPRSELSPVEAIDADLQEEIGALSYLPRVSLRGGRARVQRSDNLEIAYRATAGSRSYRFGVSKERVAQTALTLSAPDGFASDGDILPDLFSNASVFNAGGYSGLGATASMTQSLGSSLTATMTLGSEMALTPPGSDAVVGSPEQLRSMIRAGRRQTLTARVSGRAPWSGTQFSTAYQWGNRHAVTPALTYSTQRNRTHAGLNLYLRQPIPSFPLLPIRMEANAELRNLLAEGYMSIATADGGRLILMQTPRSLRGGVSFIF